MLDEDDEMRRDINARLSREERVIDSYEKMIAAENNAIRLTISILFVCIVAIIVVSSIYLDL